MALLQVRNLSVEIASPRGVLPALEQVSFDINKGEILGVVGESGAGKSLAGSAIIGLLAPPARIASGEIHFDGRRIDKLAPQEMRRLRGRSIGAVFQDASTALNPLLTVGHQLIETIRTHLPMSPTQARARAIELLQEVGVAAAQERMARYPHEFSGGMRQRAVIALALAGNPRLIVADEPTTALDVSVQAQILALLRRLAREQGVAVMLVTHDMGVVAQACDRMVVMYAGRVVEAGPVRAVLDHPSHPYTAGLKASIPSIEQPRGRLQQIEGAMPGIDERPQGCAFHPRCPHAWERCVVERPALFSNDDAVLAACWLREAGPSS